MFPWNAFLTAFDYFNSADMFCTLPSFQFIMSIVFNIATVTFQFLGVVFGERIPLSFRMVLTFAPFVVAMVLVPFVRQIVDGTTARLGFVLGLVFLSGMSTAIGFNCVIGLASQFPPEYVGAVMLGQGVAGILVGAIRIITKASFGETKSGVNTSTLLYFLLAAGVEVLCLLMYFVLIRTKFARYNMAKASASKTQDSETVSLLGGRGEGEQPKASVKIVLRKVLLQGFTVWSVFFVTLTLFPGMTSVIPANVKDFPFDSAWFGVVNIFLFQLFDFIGRTLPRWVVIIRPRALWIFSVSRVVFAALFILCIVPNLLVDPRTLAVIVHPIFFSNWASFVIMAFFALTNGYFGTLAMMFAPSCVEDHEKNVAGMIMSVFLQLGIFSAVLFALFVLFLVQPCNLPDFLMPAGLNCTMISCNATLANATNAFLL